MPADKKQIFETLSKIPVGKYVKHSQSENYDGSVTYLPYLPWTHAHQFMMAQYPEYEWSFSENPAGLEVFYFKDGTAEVRVVMSVGDVTMIASKTVTNGTGKSYPNPNANDIHNAKMRCRTRAMAELGLGWDLWVNPQNYPYTEPKSVVKEALKKAEDSEAEKPKQAKAEDLFSSLRDIHDEKVAKAKFKLVKNAYKNRKMDMDALEKRWTELKKRKGWK